MEITCWSCKTKTALDKVAMEAAIKKMNDTKLGFYDVPCAKCGKVNRTQRTVFMTALLNLNKPAEAGPKVAAPMQAMHAPAAAPAPAPAKRQAKVIVRSLHVRADHSTTSETVAGLARNQEVEVFETWTDGKNTWARIGEGTWAAVEHEGKKLMEFKA